MSKLQGSMDQQPALDPKAIIHKAVACDQSGRYIEAEELYWKGTDMLLELVDSDIGAEFETRKTVYDRIADYRQRAKHLKEHLRIQLTRGNRVANFNIADNSMGHSYESLFHNYLDGEVREAIIDEPCLSERQHFRHLLVFVETMLRRCPNLKYIRLATKPTGQPLQDLALGELKEQLARRDISMNTRLDESLNMPRIVLSNGYIIRISRGLHIYKEVPGRFTIGQSDFSLRRCHLSEVDVWRTRRDEA